MLTNVKSIPVGGAVHNVYVTSDSRYVVVSSVVTSVIRVIDTQTNQVGFTKNPDGSTKEIIAQLSDFHGFVVVDFASHKEINRITLPDISNQQKVTDGLQGCCRS
jgi:TolB-like protein